MASVRGVTHHDLVTDEDEAANGADQLLCALNGYELIATTVDAVHIVLAIAASTASRCPMAQAPTAHRDRG